VNAVSAQTQALGFWQHAAQDPGRLALVDTEERRWSRAELAAQSNQIANGLRALGLQQGDVVAAILPNCREFIALNLGITQIGLHLVPINWHLAGPEVAYILQDSGARVLLTHEQLAPTVNAALRETRPEHLFALGNIEGFLDFNAWVAAQNSAIPSARVGGTILNYTSGTTGRPKGVYRRVRASMPPERCYDPVIATARGFGIRDEADNVHCLGSPLYHTAPMQWTMQSLYMGHAVVVMNKWEPDRMLDLIEKYRVTTTHMVPTQFVRLLKLPQEVRARYDVSSLKHVVHAAAPCPVEVKRSMMNWWGPILHEYYGATEGGGTLSLPQDWLRYPGTVGKAVGDMEIKIMDEAGCEVPRGEIGVVYMRRLASTDFEYRGDPEKTQQAKLGDYFTVGDVGHLNDAGYLFLSDRKIDMIISGGANIYPAEIESELILHPAVADCAVFGVPNDDWGEEIKAVVQPADGIEGTEALTQELLQYLSARIGKMKLPKSIDYMQALPRDANGKLYKRRLRDPYWQGRERRI